MLKMSLAFMVGLILCLTVIPQDLSCSDHHDPVTTHHHCSLSCSSCLSGVIVSGVVAENDHVVDDFSFQPLSLQDYQNPAEMIFVKPPIFLF